MAAAKMIETKAQEYRRVKEERRAQAETFDVPLPSGVTWKLRKVQLPQYVKSGVMPMSLASKLASAAQGVTSEQAFLSLSPEDQERVTTFMKIVVADCVVDPRIYLKPTSDDQMTLADVEEDDFDAIFAWAMPGGDIAETLETFRSE
jgi:hypothetical protein